MPSSEKENILAKPYVPIDTDLVDNIEHYSSDHLHVHIDYKDADGVQKSMRGFIADVYTTDSHEEFLKMEDGRILRLDQLLSVVAPDDVKVSDRDVTADLRDKREIDESRFFPNGID